MDMENKIYVSDVEYSRLCRVDGKMDALIGYIQGREKEKGFVDSSVIKSIIGMEYFEEE